MPCYLQKKSKFFGKARIHTRGQYLRKFIETVESVYMRRELISHRIGLERQYGRRDVMCNRSFVAWFKENTLLVKYLAICMNL